MPKSSKKNAETNTIVKLLKKPSSTRIMGLRAASFSPRNYGPIGEGSESSGDDCKIDGKEIGDYYM